MNEKIDQAIFTHSRLKFNLKKAIETGEGRAIHEEVKNHHVCALGKWLDSVEGKTLPNYPEVVMLHQEFHKEAYQVFNLAMTGKKDEAMARLRLRSKFSQLSSKLVNKLVETNPNRP
jgi:hypothetical protein